MGKQRNEGKNLEAEEKRLKEMDFSFQQVNDYPLSDKTLVVNPQIVPLFKEELPATEIKEI